MSSYANPDGFLLAYGGTVVAERSPISEFGDFSLKFNRPLIYPEELCSEYIPGYTEVVPAVAPTPEELIAIEMEYAELTTASEVTTASSESEDSTEEGNGDNDDKSTGDSSDYENYGGGGRKLSDQYWERSPDI